MAGPSCAARCAINPLVSVHRLRRALAPQYAALVAVLGLATVLNVRLLSQNGFANNYYAAAVKSMLGSLHRFLFVSSDPGGLVMIDKPPLGLWLQTLSAKLFGFSSLSLLLPQAILGVIAVLALYFIVARRFGPLAGLAAALTLAVFPSFVAVSRDNNLDTPLIVAMLIACGLGVRATETGRLRHLLASALVLGLAFNVKTLAAFLAAPGIALAFLVCSPQPLVRRLLSLLAAGAVLAAVSLSWLLYVDATPKSQRPFVGSSTDNTEIGLTLGYNGLGRVGGQVGGPGRIPGSRPRAAGASQRIPTRHGRALHPIAFGGPIGPLRLFGSGLGVQGGWIIPFALFGLIAAVLGARARRDPETATVIVFGGWFFVEAAALSLSKGIVHPYYVSALGPGAAAMCGVAVVTLAALVRRSRLWVLLALGAFAATVAAQAVMLDREHYLRWDMPLIAGAAAIATIAMLIRRRLATPALALALAALLVAPTAYAMTTWDGPVEGTFPAAGPHQTLGAGGVGIAPGSLRVNSSLISYLRSHRPGSRWQLLTDASSTAAPLILLGLTAAPIGGYSGTDPVLDGPALADHVRRGEARYVMLGGAYSSRGGNLATQAVAAACREIPPLAWRPYELGPNGMPVVPKAGRTVLTLFDCRGRADQLSGRKSAAPPAAPGRRAQRVAPRAPSLKHR